MGDLSGRGYCPRCAELRYLNAMYQIREKRGPVFEHWARRQLLAAHAALIASERGSGVESEA